MIYQLSLVQYRESKKIRPSENKLVTEGSLSVFVVGRWTGGQEMIPYPTSTSLGREGSSNFSSSL